MKAWIFLAVLVGFVSIVLAAGPPQKEDEVTEHHGPSKWDKSKLREKQGQFIKRAMEIKEDYSMSDEEKAKELHKLREHAMMYMGPHAILPKALLHSSPIEPVETRRKELVRQVEHIAIADLEFEDKKERLREAREQFKADMEEIHRGLPTTAVNHARQHMKKQAHANAYKEMINQGLRGEAAAKVRGQAFREAMYSGVQKMTAGLKNKESGQYRRDLEAQRVKNAPRFNGKVKRRAAKVSESRPDM
ncbi:uncharacterized protein [Diadema antillarum]|uniref:uncharacterized protein n=1 Tax=Diadema antillarum TaxID=105358 RepID=UPI003A8B849B